MKVDCIYELQQLEGLQLDLCGNSKASINEKEHISAFLIGRYKGDGRRLDLISNPVTLERAQVASSGRILPESRGRVSPVFGVTGSQTKLSIMQWSAAWNR